MLRDKMISESLLVNGLKERFGDSILETKIDREEVTHLINKERFVNICMFLKSDVRLKFNFLSDLLAVDYHPQVPRFEVIYHLYSIPHKHRLRLKIKIDEFEKAPSVTHIWRSSDWAEREAYDMLGIVFDKHPNLRRIYLPGDWDGFPLRKDYPLRGYKDRYNPFGEEKK
ncbi:MAG: NADH-quinone oxidoreductase subunit C [Thermodesulfobacteriota bacterium]